MISKDGHLTFTPKPGFTGALPDIRYNLTDDGKTIGDTSSVHITVAPHTLKDDNEFKDGAENKPISGNLTENAVYENGAKANCKITDVMMPNGQHLSQGQNGHFSGNVEDPQGKVLGTIDIDPNSGAYTFTPSKGWSGTIGTGQIPPIMYTLQDSGGAIDSSGLFLRVNPDWATQSPQQPVDGGKVTGTVGSLPDLHVAPGQAHYYIAKAGVPFDPLHPQSSGQSALGTVSVDAKGQIHFTEDKQRELQWAQNNQNLVGTKTIQQTNQGGTTHQTGSPTIHNPSGRTLGVASAPPGWSHGGASWKHPSTGEIIQPPATMTAGGRLGFFEEWIVYNEKGEPVGNYWITADLTVTTTTTQNQEWRNTHPTGGPNHADWKWVNTGTSTSTTHAEITNIAAGVTPPSAGQKGSSAPPPPPPPPADAPDSADDISVYINLGADAAVAEALATLDSQIQKEIKDLHITEIKVTAGTNGQSQLTLVADEGTLQVLTSGAASNSAGNTPHSSVDASGLSPEFLNAHPGLQQTNLDQGFNPAPKDFEPSDAAYEPERVDGEKLASALELMKGELENSNATNPDQGDSKGSGKRGNGIPDEDPTNSQSSQSGEPIEASPPGEPEESKGQLLLKSIQSVQEKPASEQDNTNGAITEIPVSQAPDPFETAKNQETSNQQDAYLPEEPLVPLTENQDTNDHLS